MLLLFTKSFSFRLSWVRAGEGVIACDHDRIRNRQRRNVCYSVQLQVWHWLGEGGLGGEGASAIYAAVFA